MCEMLPVSELVRMPINWVRGDDARLGAVFESLRGGGCVKAPIRILRCGCGKSYMLEDGGHRIAAAHRILKKTGRDILIPVHFCVADFD